MVVSRRKRRTRMKLRYPERMDMISNLPNEVLGRILSLLPTKCAVSTCVLSSKWRYLYQLTTTLDFDDSIASNKKENGGIRRRNTRFEEFVTRMLDQCQSSLISKFRLKCEDDVKVGLLEDWICAVIVHKIEEFDLSIARNRQFDLELSRLTCETLVVLKLDCAFTLYVPNSVEFPKLKVLFVERIVFPRSSGCPLLVDDEPASDYHGLNGILSKCPLLEELAIRGCTWNGGDLYFTNRWLRSLTLNLGLDAPSDQLNGCTIYMDLPSLVYLNYSECIAEQFEIRNMNSIKEAYIEICFNDDEFEEQQDLCDAMLELITGISSCRSLEMSRQCLEALTSGEFELPSFQNLTHLSLALGINVSWNDVLLDFLNCSPRLEVLTLQQVPLRKDYVRHSDGKFLLMDEEHVPFLLKDEAVPSCVRWRLKSITVVDFRGFKGEMQMIRYFLDSANVLETMAIHWDIENRTRNFAAKEEDILELPKSSISCSISFQ